MNIRIRRETSADIQAIEALTAAAFPETHEAVLQCAIDAAREEHFIGLGLGGIEVGFPASLFAESFREARRNGLRVVAHAGETSGPNTISDAIHVLQAERIGHGIRCLDSPQLVDELRAMRMPLEVCPTSKGWRLSNVTFGWIRLSNDPTLTHNYNNNVTRTCE